MAMSTLNRTVAIVTCLAIWLVWGLSFLRPGVKDNMLAKLPSFASHNSSSSAAGQGPKGPADELRPLVLYTYAESDNARANLAFFVRNGLHAGADFVFIFNGDTDAPALLPAGLPNVRVVRRANTCFDMGAHGEVLRQDGLWRRYRRFVLMNASVRGPFRPTYAAGCWMDAFLGRLTDRVKVCTYSLEQEDEKGEGGESLV